MRKEENRTIIQQIQPYYDELHLKMKAEKNAQSKTNQDIADTTGLSFSTVSKFFTGQLSDPGVFGVSAICIDLAMSLDELMGIDTPPPGADIERLQVELDHKDALLHKTEEEVELLKERSRLMDRGLMQKEKQITETRKTWKPIIYGLCGLCIMLAAVLMVYIVLDAQHPDVGLIQGVENTSVVVWVGISAVIMTALLLAHIAISRWYRKMKKDDEIESN